MFHLCSAGTGALGEEFTSASLWWPLRASGHISHIQCPGSEYSRHQHSQMSPRTEYPPFIRALKER